LNKKYQKPCHAINVFIPLVDLHEKNGPTEFCIGTHYLGYEDYNKDLIDIPLAKAGSPVIFDYRLGHRGLGNNSKEPRPIVYLTYTTASKEFRDSVNFSSKRYRKLGEMVEKPLSRKERALKRTREP
jgi:ectoine hydroxylase-related dioxygenase (phytanoyl-CoA dioxygenase family)